VHPKKKERRDPKEKRGGGSLAHGSGSTAFQCDGEKKIALRKIGKRGSFIRGGRERREA